MQPVHFLLAATTPAALACFKGSIDGGSADFVVGRSARQAGAEIDAGKAAVKIDAEAGEPEKAEF